MFKHHLLVMLGLITACALPVGGKAHAATVRVHMKDMAFSPSSVTVAIGDKVKWMNDDFVEHSATATNKAFNIVVPPHKTGSVTIDKAGMINYYCRFHPMMKGTVRASDKN